MDCIIQPVVGQFFLLAVRSHEWKSYVFFFFFRIQQRHYKNYIQIQNNVLEMV